MCIAPPKTESQRCFFFAFTYVKVFVSCGRPPVDVVAKVTFLESSELPKTFTGPCALVTMDTGINARACQRCGCAQRWQTQCELLGFDFKARAWACRRFCRCGDHLVENGFHDCLGCIGPVGTLKDEIFDASPRSNGFKAQSHSMPEDGDGECVNVFGRGRETSL